MARNLVTSRWIPLPVCTKSTLSGQGGGGSLQAPVNSMCGVVAQAEVPSVHSLGPQCCHLALQSPAEDRRHKGGSPKVTLCFLVEAEAVCFFCHPQETGVKVSSKKGMSSVAPNAPRWQPDSGAQPMFLSHLLLEFVLLPPKYATPFPIPRG